MRLLTVILLLLGAISTSAQQLPMDASVRHGKLDNGLTYYIYPNAQPRQEAEFYIVQRVGSILEEEHQRGLAHFLEHMAFNGTKHFPGKRLISYLEENGVKFGTDINAYTSFDQTVYSISNVPTQRTGLVDSCLLILHDWSGYITLDAEEIDAERKVIHEEWRTKRSVRDRIYEQTLPKLFPDSNRYAYRMPIGLMEVVDNFPHQALRDYYHKWYRPDLQAIIVVGDIDADYVEAKIKEMFSPIVMPENPAERIYYGVDDNEEPIVVTDKDPEQTMTIVSLMQKHQPLWPEDQKNTVEYLRHQAVKSMVMGMFSSRMQDITLKPETPFLMASFSEGDFLLSKVAKCTDSYIVPKEGQTYPSVTAAVQIMCTILDHGFLQSELDRRRASFLSAIDLQYQNRNKRENGTYIQECLNNFLNNEPLVSLETEVAAYKQILPTITLDEVNALYAKMFSRDMKNLVVLVMNPDKEGYTQPSADSLLLAVKAGMEAKTVPYVDETASGALVKNLPAPGKVVKSKAGAYGSKELTLSNGVRVVMLPTTHNDNEILMQAYSPGGTNRYGAEDYITLEAAGELCSVSKLGGYKQTDIRKMLAGKQAQASGSMGSQNEYISGGSSRQDLETMMQLVYLQFQPLQPDMDAAQNMMTQYYTMLQGKESNPLSWYADSVSSTLYGKNPRNIVMKKELLSAISYQRALEIWADRFADASDFTFFFVGTFDEDTLSKYCCQYLATLPTVKRNDKPVYTDLVIRKGNIQNIYKAKMEQPQAMASLIMHAPAKKKNIKDEIVMSILGQAMQMNYTKTIREDLGASYGVGASGSHYDGNDGKYNYMFSVQGNVKPEMYDTCLTVMRQELQKVADNGIPAEYMQRVKEYMRKTYQERQNKNGAWLSYLQSYYRYGIDVQKDYLPTLEKVSQKDIMRAVKALLKSKNEVTVVILPEEK